MTLFPLKLTSFKPRVSFDLTERSWLTLAIVLLSSGSLLAYSIWMLLERNAQPVVVYQN